MNVESLNVFTLSRVSERLNSSTRTYTNNGRGAFVNKGVIKSVNEGYFVFIGEHVSKQGLITAQRGTVALGADSTTRLKFNGPSLVSIADDQSLLDTLIKA